eukprot:COSAG01_NODE_2087_length_8456_cov_2.656456_3_plen_121_part_00
MLRPEAVTEISLRLHFYEYACDLRFHGIMIDAGVSSANAARAPSLSHPGDRGVIDQNPTAHADTGATQRPATHQRGHAALAGMTLVATLRAMPCHSTTRAGSVTEIPLHVCSFHVWLSCS